MNSSPQRVTHLITSLDVGGTEKQLLLLLPELQKSVHNEVVCLMGRGAIGRQLEAAGISVHYVGRRRQADVITLWLLWRHLRKRRPAILVTYLIYADIVGRFIGRLAGVRIIIASHRSSLFGPAYWHQLDRFTRWLVTHYTTQTEATKELLQRILRVPADRLSVIPNAVAAEARRPVPRRQELSTSSTDLVITCVANLKPEKGLPILLQAFEAVYARHQHLHLWLVGEGPEREALTRQRAGYASRGHIHFLGLRNDVPAILAASDIFVLPTQIEGMSNALLEAMQMGLPCLTTDLPVNREVIKNSETGILFPVDDTAGLATRLERLVTQPKLRRALGSAAATQAATRYGVAHVAQQWLRLFRRLTT